MDESNQQGHERTDLEPRYIALFGAVLASVIVLAAAVTFLFLKVASLRHLARQAPALPPAREQALAPRLQVQGSKELREMRGAEDRVLNSYAWIDKEAGIVRIPVERAMEILAEKEGERREATGMSKKKERERSSEIGR